MPAIRLTKSDLKLLQEVQALKKTEKEWSTKPDAIRRFRARLLELQENRCAYCQGTIESIATGYIELDHIIPKAPNGERKDRLVSNDFSDRNVTTGYPEFTFEPKNLVVTCKACNASKNSFDPITNRSQPIGKYPNKRNIKEKITWYHPHFHNYSEHIERTPEWTFSHITAFGDYTIKACKLDIPNELEKRFQARADASLTHSKTVRIAINSLATSVLQDRYGREQAITALHSRCQLTRRQAGDLLDAWIRHVDEGSWQSLEKANQALIGVAIIWEGKEKFDSASAELECIAEESEDA
jgi:5-methylcytosine-specific restriction endonuclease McrA